MKTQDTNFNPKMSSEPLEEKPFLTEEDCDKAYEISPCTEAKDYYSGFLTAASKANARISELEKAIRLLLTGLKAENIDQLVLKAMPEDYLTYGKLYSNIAQDKISSLESELKALENRYKDLSGALRFKYEECEALREERDGLFKLTVLAYESLSVVRTEPTMSGAVLSSFDKKKFITKYNLFFDALETFITSVDGKKLLEQFKAYTLNTEKN